MDHEVQIKRAPNLRLLHEEIAAQLGPVFTGLSRRGDTLILHLQDGATGSDIATARAAVQGHDPEQLTAEQQKARQLENDRASELSDRLNVDAYLGEPQLVLDLALKVAWLEREVADLRGML